jgi:GNAT superfamily N-acetyltransferase
MEESARRASSGDLDALIGLAAAARRELPERKGGDVAVRLDPQRNDPGARIATAIDDEATVLFVGTIGYGLMALGTVSDGSAQANVEEIFVDPGARSVGVGEAILEALVMEASERGAVAIQSVALPGDRATKNFFEAHGMVARAIVVHRWLDER